MTGRQRLVLHGVAAAVTLLVLAPWFAPGYVLSYDLVFVPHQPLRWDLVAPAGGLPRAVPQDAVVSLLSLVVPGWLLERLAVGGAIYAASIGAGRLVPAQRLLTRVVAAVGYAWTPFLAERFLLGQWGLLLAYGALPWLVAACFEVRRRVPGALPRLIVPAAVCALTPTGGLLALGTTVVLIAGRRRPRRVERGRANGGEVGGGGGADGGEVGGGGANGGDIEGGGADGGARGWARGAVAGIGAVTVLQLPWIVAAATTEASGRTDPAGVAAFAARGENWSGPVGALAGTGGIWNALTTPASRGSALVPVLTIGLIALAVLGFRVLRERWPAGDATRLALLAGIGFAIALLGVVPGLSDGLAWVVGRVPGAGVLRDGHKFLAPYALLLVVCAALGVERLAARLAEPRARLVLLAAALLPVAVMPDLAWGGAGALRPVRYPADWDRVAAHVAAEPGEVLSLPFHEYLAYGWNRGRVVIDPAPRYLDADVLADDTLRVGEVALRGENPRAARVRELLAAGQPVSGTGVRWVLVQRQAGGAVPEGALAGLQLVYSGQFLDLYANPAVTRGLPPNKTRGSTVLSVDLAVLALVIAAVWRLRRRPT